MKFTNRVDVALPADVLFHHLSDFATVERSALRKGIAMRRLDALTVPGAGMSWDVAFRLRGRERQLIADVTRYEPVTRVDYAGTSAGFAMTLMLDFTELSKKRTRLSTLFEITPRTLGARLLLQSAKLGRGNLERRYDARIKTFLRELENRAEPA